MNDVLISRSKLLEDINFDREAAKVHPQEMCERFNRFCDYAEELVKDALAVDAEPVRHGYWIPQDNTRTKFMCSDCKGRNHDGSGKYCSECGCKMDAEVNNDGSNSAEY